MTNATTPEWADIIAEALDTRLAGTHTAMPGQVTYVYTSPDLARQYADVRPCIRHAVPTDFEDMDATVPWTEEDLPILQRVPIAYPQGGGFAITWPIAVNDFVLLVFAERSLRHWLATARKASTSTVSAEDIDPHTLDGAVALPLGPAPLGELLARTSSSDMVLGHDTGKRIHIAPDRIMLGGDNPTELAPVSRADYTDAAINQIRIDLATLIIATSTSFGACAPAGTANPKVLFDTATQTIPSEYPQTGSAVTSTE